MSRLNDYYLGNTIFIDFRGKITGRIYQNGYDGVVALELKDKDLAFINDNFPCIMWKMMNGYILYINCDGMVFLGKFKIDELNHEEKVFISSYESDDGTLTLIQKITEIEKNIRYENPNGKILVKKW